MRSALASEIMSRPVMTLAPDATARDAAAFLSTWGVSGAPVTDARGRVLGIVSLTDVARHVRDPRDLQARTLEGRERLARSASTLTDDVPVTELMTRGVLFVFPDSPLRDVVRSMISERVHRVLVMSDDNRLEGIITSMDVLRWLDGRLSARERPRERQEA
jgi:CBS domain-containing protein